MRDLISVIVPVYNVEKYVGRCLESICNQTYQNLEVLVVDDGSPDNSINICKEKAQIDDRIRILRKKNGGLASARNEALDVVNGKYIVCVDSDDWIESNMIEMLYNNLIEYNADMSVCDFYQEKDNDTIYNQKEKGTILLSREEAMEYAILPSKYYGFAWNKMYKKELIQDLRYNETFLKGEDSPFTCSYINKCNRVVYSKIPLYHYRIDSISISRSKFNLGKMTVLDSYMSIIDLLKENEFSKYLIDLQYEQYANQLLSVIVNIATTNSSIYKKEFYYIKKEMKKYKKIYIKSSHFDLFHKITYFFVIYFTVFFKITCKLKGEHK